MRSITFTKKLLTCLNEAATDSPVYELHERTKP